MRDLAAKLIAPALKMTGYRFHKRHRHEQTRLWSIINTTLANQLANGPI